MAVEERRKTWQENTDREIKEGDVWKAITFPNRFCKGRRRVALNDLLKAHGLTQHPFAAWRAEDEEKDLAEWFIPPPFFDDILGNLGTTRESMKPSSHLIFGMPGGGKTALRKTVERELLTKSPASAVIRYTDFTRVLSGETARPSLSRHVDELLRLGTVSLLAMWYESRDRYEKLNVSQRADLAGLIMDYYEVLPPSSKDVYISSLSPYAGRALSIAKKSGHTVVDGYNAIISVIKKEKFEPTKWNGLPAEAEKAEPMIRLQRFWALAKAMSVDNIWVLVDGVDEHPSARTGEAIFQCVAEILLNQRLMEFREEDKQVMCFKVFLTRPDELRPLLDAEKFRKDRIPVRKIEWKRKDLDIALKRRLAHYSNRMVLSFDNLCEAKLRGTHDRMLDECGLNPRTLFFMGYQIFAAFQNTEAGVAKIDKDSIDEGIKLAKDAVL